MTASTRGRARHRRRPHRTARAARWLGAHTGELLIAATCVALACLLVACFVLAP
ncbi:hypothetical protein [Streptomyces marincola]|uniref:hypothetical protein n=1 Tax=Streptomyces marincola TaxID=2878388 RepID=UPI00131BA9DF|nr:hypothetical protein [Streptomyces marincola]